MEIVIQSNQYVISNIGMAQQVPGRKYRFNKFCVTTDIKDGILIYNMFTSSLIKLSKMEYEKLDYTKPYDYIDFLISNWFLVPEEYDEDKVLKVLKQRQEILLTENYLDNPSLFTILTTSTCNARCFYCYELGLKNKAPMSIETAEKVADYIVKYHDKKANQISLDWFGGEPLLNTKVIDLICFRVMQNNINYVGSMVTNGYLFDDELIRKAQEEWRIKSIQITLDGTEEVYNKTKAYIYKDCESPFKRVISNIRKLINAKIKVSIRMNCDKHNFEDLIKLVDFLKAEFSDISSDILSLYVYPIFEEGFTRTKEERKELFEHLEQIERHIYETFGTMTGGIRRDIIGVHCMVDKGNAVCIYPKGEIGVCEHYLDKKFVSHIDTPLKKNWDVLRQWREYSQDTELCKDCPLRPECLKVKGCPDEIPCDEFQKEYNIKHTKIGIMKAWNEYIQNNKNNINQCNGNCQMPNCPRHDPCYNSQYNNNYGNY